MSIFKRRRALQKADGASGEVEPAEPITGLYDEEKPEINKKYKTAASVTGVIKFTVLAVFSYTSWS